MGYGSRRARLLMFLALTQKRRNPALFSAKTVGAAHVDQAGSTIFCLYRVIEGMGNGDTEVWV